MALKYHYHRLANGLDVVAEANPHAHSFAAGFFVRTGSRDESPAVNGISHFLEHMLFKGSEKYSAEDVNRIFDEMGAQPNAETGQESTCYYAHVLPEFSKRVLQHLALLLQPSLRQSDFDMEKKVILEEIAMCQDEPGHRVYEALMQAHFGKHPLGQSVIGSAKCVSKLKRRQMLDYLRKRYVPGNTVLVASGQLKFDRLVKWADEFCGHWPAAQADRRPAQPSHRPQKKHRTDAKLNRQYTMALMPAPSAQDPRRFAAKVLSDVIGDSDGSRFYWALVDNAIADEADFSFYPHDGCGSFFIALTTDPKRSQRALDIALAELKRVATDLTDDEVERAKNKLASSVVLQGESPMGRMRAIGGQWVYNREYRSIEDDLATLAAINTNSLRQILADFPFAPMTIVSLGPKNR